MENEQIREFIENAIKENSVMLFMKGTPDQPACGFSMRTSACLNALGVRYAALDILPDPRIRQVLSSRSGWPTIPQLFVDGKLVSWGVPELDTLKSALHFTQTQSNI